MKGMGMDSPLFRASLRLWTRYESWDVAYFNYTLLVSDVIIQKRIRCPMETADKAQWPWAI